LDHDQAMTLEPETVSETALDLPVAF